jgi:hypothetical protein
MHPMVFLHNIWKQMELTFLNIEIITNQLLFHNYIALCISIPTFDELLTC